MKKSSKAPPTFHLSQVGFSLRIEGHATKVSVSMILNAIYDKFDQL
jgi:hypothetical protein